MTYTAMDVANPIWDRFFWVSPLVIVGTSEPDGSYDLAPKHMATPMGWQNYFGFVCTPRHATYTNTIREEAFTVSYPRPDQLVHTSLSAVPRCEDGQKSFRTHSPHLGFRATHTRRRRSRRTSGCSASPACG